MSDEQSIATANPVEYREIPQRPGYRAGTDASVWTRWKIFRKPRGYGSYSEISGEWLQMKPRLEQNGYLRIGFRVKGVLIKHSLARVILETFVGPCPEGMQSCHNDGNPLNNHLVNLRWDTAKNNSQDRIRHGTQTRGESNGGGGKLTEEQVREIRIRYAAGEYSKPLGKAYQVHQSTICRITRREIWAHVT